MLIKRLTAAFPAASKTRGDHDRAMTRQDAAYVSPASNATAKPSSAVA
jgi:hypothetical protein